MRSISEKTWIDGYGPCWDSRSNRLIFLDCFESTITSYDMKNGCTFTAILPGLSLPTFVIPLAHKHNQYLVNSNKIAVVIEWNGKDPEVKIVRQAFKVESQPKYIANGLHMALASSDGQFFLGGTFRGSQCSNIPAPNGSFYSYSEKTGVIKHEIPNLKQVAGVALNSAGDKLYIVDLCNRVIHEFDFDSETGCICKCFKWETEITTHFFNQFVDFELHRDLMIN